MTTNTRIDTKSLSDKAKASKDKEAYKLLERTPAYRIGVGSRSSSSDTPTYFVEIVLNLGKVDDKVDANHLEKAKTCLKDLQSLKYSLTYEEGNSITCEITKIAEELNDEYQAVKQVMQKHFSENKQTD